MKRLRINPIATTEFNAAVDWYNREQPGLGDRFADAVQRRIDEIRAKPKRFPCLEDPYREAQLIDFPYMIVYEEKPSAIVIVAVYHTHRDPDGWKHRA